MVSKIDALPYKDVNKMDMIARNTTNTKQKLGLGLFSDSDNGNVGARQWGSRSADSDRGNIKTQQRGALGKSWNFLLADELHKPVRRNFPRCKVGSSAVDNIWSADLVDMQNIAKYNIGNRYILNVIDLYSRYVWSLPLKNKSSQSIVEAFIKIVKNGRKPLKLWVDNGSEFYNKLFKKWLNDNNIQMYSTFNEGKALVIERFNRTLKHKMHKYFTAQNTYEYINILDDFINEYNSTHRSIKMTPTEANTTAINNATAIGSEPLRPQVESSKKMLQVHQERQE